MSRTFTWISALLVAALVAVSDASAEERKGPVDQAVEVDEVVVTASQLNVLAQFLNEAADTTNDRQFARWNSKICPLALGLSERQNTYVQSRVTDLARQVGAEVAEQSCRPNVLILFSAQPEKMLRAAFRAKKLRLPGEQPLAVSRFLSTDRPVRWWHRIEAEALFGESGAIDEEQASPVLRSNGSRIRIPVQGSFRAALIVVDTRKAAGMKFRRLAGYLAMASLGQMDPDADLAGFPTVLNAFSSSKEEAEKFEDLTEWDVAYLRALYSAASDRYGLAQRGEITRRMGRTLKTNSGDEDSGSKWP